MISMVSTIANDGERMKLRLVKQIINSQTSAVEEVSPENTGRVISEKTAKDVLSMMSSVVGEGTGKNAKVAGYTVGGKTGSAQIGINGENGAHGWFVGFAPYDDPEIAVVVLENESVFELLLSILQRTKDIA